MTKSADMSGIAYVAGYGRSGSTLLCQLLGASQSVLPVGELSALFTCLATDAWNCSCGAQVRDCTFWRGVLQDAYGRVPDISEAAHLANVQLKVESVRSSIFGVREPWIAEYRDSQRRLLTALLARLPREPGVVLDSSKTVYNTTSRPAALAAATGLRVRLIHLVRDPRGIWWSLARRGLNRDLEKQIGRRARLATTRTVLGWATANTAAQRSAIPTEDRTFIRYEDLVARPASVLATLADFLDVRIESLAAILGGDRILDESHQVAGNRRRFNGSGTIRPDSEWEGRIPLFARSAIEIPLARMMASYGYGR